MLYYFIAYYSPEKAFSYNAEKNTFLPYSPIYRRRYASLEQARAAARHARHKNPDKRNYIFIDAAISHTIKEGRPEA